MRTAVKSLTAARILTFALDVAKEGLAKPGNDGGEPLENQISFLKEKGGAE